MFNSMDGRSIQHVHESNQKIKTTIKKDSRPNRRQNQPEETENREKIGEES